MKDCIFKKQSDWKKLSDETFSFKMSNDKFIYLTYNKDINKWTAGFPDPNDFDNLIWIMEEELEVAKLKVAVKCI